MIYSRESSNKRKDFSTPHFLDQETRPREVKLLAPGHTAMDGPNQYSRVKSSQLELDPPEVPGGRGLRESLKPFSAGQVAMVTSSLCDPRQATSPL